MASSLVELQDFKLGQHHMFPDTNDLQAFEEWLTSMDLPTPPLSPDHTDLPTTTPNSTQLESPDDEDLDVDGGESILQHMMASEDILFDSQSTNYGSEDSLTVIDMDPSVLLSGGTPQALLQDCMWNSEEYEPRHSIGNNGGMYTPASSPPPEDKDPIVNDEVDGGGGYRRRGSSVTSGNSRDHPQASTSSESEEEIDVVTITQDKQANRVIPKKRVPSISAPCSRHVSPSHMPPTKKRKCHSKRTHRLNSSGSSFGEGTESDDEHRRASHNILERRRRNDLKYSFQILRGQIPELEDNQRAPKVTILKKAAEYIKEIRDREDEMVSRMAKERKRESKLLQRLEYLKSMP